MCDISGLVPQLDFWPFDGCGSTTGSRITAIEFMLFGLRNMDRPLQS